MRLCTFLTDGSRIILFFYLSIEKKRPACLYTKLRKWIQMNAKIDSRMNPKGRRCVCIISLFLCDIVARLTWLRFWSNKFAGMRSHRHTDIPNQAITFWLAIAISIQCCACFLDSILNKCLILSRVQRFIVIVVFSLYFFLLLLLSTDDYSSNSRLKRLRT